MYKMVALGWPCPNLQSDLSHESNSLCFTRPFSFAIFLEVFRILAGLGLGHLLLGPTEEERVLNCEDASKMKIIAEVTFERKLGLVLCDQHGRLAIRDQLG